MKQKIKILFELFCFLFLMNSCSPDNKPIKVYPLGKATEWGILVTPSYENRSLNDTLKFKKFIFEGNLEQDTTTIKKRIFEFIDTSENEFVSKSSRCQIEFYKTSSNLNKDFVTSKWDGLGGHLGDKIAELIWLNGKLYWVKLYKDEKILSSYFLFSKVTHS